jgi:CRP-like cAMP-binding protein
MSAAARSVPEDNLLLAALSPAEYRKFLPELELVSLASGEVIAEASSRITHGYFPTTAVISINTAMAGHVAEEVGVVGNEGLSGVSLLLEGEGALASTRSSVVQSAGYAYRVRTDFLLSEFLGNGEIRQLLLRYTQALITQIAQIGVCNRHHRLAEQFGRWLLLRLDRAPGNELHATQAQIAASLGVRREGVTEAANALHRAGIIDYRRGDITVLDRSELERSTCECYALIRKEYARLVPDGRRHNPLGHNPPGMHQQREHERLQA